MVSSKSATPVALWKFAKLGRGVLQSRLAGLPELAPSPTNMYCE